jgi:hypothetical protein
MAAGGSARSEGCGIGGAGSAVQPVILDGGGWRAACWCLSTSVLLMREDSVLLTLFGHYLPLPDARGRRDGVPLSLFDHYLTTTRCAGAPGQCAIDRYLTTI